MTIHQTPFVKFILLKCDVLGALEMSVLNNSLCAVLGSKQSPNSTIYLTGTELAAIKLFPGYSEGLLRFAMGCCIFFMAIGIPGNLVTVIALARYKKVHNATAMFIMNLSCSDLLFCCFNLPLAVSTFYHRAWMHGCILCRLYPLARYGLVAVSLITVLAITINRYVMIAHPRLYPKMYKSRNIKLTIAAIWIISTALLIATWFEKWGRFGLDVKIGSCSILPDVKDKSPKTALFLGAFILPCLAIIVCYARIFFIVRKSTKKSLNTARIPKEKTANSDSSSDSSRLVSSHHGENKVTTTCCKFLEPPSNLNYIEGSELTTIKTANADDDSETCAIGERNKTSPSLRRTALRKSMALLKLSLPTRKDRRLGTMIVAIMISFCVCHLPITITKVLNELSPRPGVNIAAYILMYLSSSMNPVIYVVMSNDYRKAYKNLFRCRRFQLSRKNNPC